MIRVTKAEWDKISKDHKSQWTQTLYDYRKDIPAEWVGKRTVLAGCIEKDGGASLLTEDVHFQIA